MFFKLKSLFNASNEGQYKVIVLFGCKLRIRSKLLALRMRISELESSQRTLKNHLQEQKAGLAGFQAKYNALAESSGAQLTELVRQIGDFQAAMGEQRQHFASELQAFDLRNQEHEKVIKNDILQLRADAKEAAGKTEAIAQRLSQLEKAEFDAQCERIVEVCRGLESRISELEKLVAAAKLNSLQANWCALASKVTEIENRSKILAQKKVNTYLKARNMNAISRDYIASLVENMYEKGISGREGEPKLIVSLTSYPRRMYDLHLCLYSLLTQDLKPDKIILWLGEEQFPNKEQDVPRKVLELQKFGLEIKWCEDTKSYKKLLPALQTYPNSVAVTADDDIYYPSDWLRRLWETYQQSGERIIAHRCHRVKYEHGVFRPYSEWKKCITDYEASYFNFMTGAGGVLYAPGSLHADILNIEKAREICPHNDDIWFWATALRNGTKIALAAKPLNSLIYINPDREANANEDGTLFAYNGSGGNDKQLSCLLTHYPEICSILAAP